MNTWSNKQTQQNERNVLALFLLGQANRATAAFYPVGIPVNSMYRDASISCQRSFSERHSDPIHSIRGFMPLSRGTLS